MMFNDYPIITSVHLVTSHEQVIQLNWRERLLSWPWKPWIKTKVVIVQIPDKKVYFDGKSFICNPILFEGLKQTLMK